MGDYVECSGTGLKTIYSLSSSQMSCFCAVFSGLLELGAPSYMSSSRVGLVLIAKSGAGHLPAALYTGFEINIRDDEPRLANRRWKTPGGGGCSALTCWVNNSSTSPGFSLCFTQHISSNSSRLIRLQLETEASWLENVIHASHG